MTVAERVVPLSRYFGKPRGLSVSAFNATPIKRDFPFGVVGFQPSPIRRDPHMGNGGIENDRLFPQVDDLGRPQAGFDHHIEDEPGILVQAVQRAGQKAGSG